MTTQKVQNLTVLEILQQIISFVTNNVGDDWEAAIVAKASGQQPQSDDESDDDDHAKSVEVPLIISATELSTHSNDLPAFAKMYNIPDMLVHIPVFQEILEKNHTKKVNSGKQTKVDDYFARR